MKNRFFITMCAVIALFATSVIACGNNDNNDTPNNNNNSKVTQIKVEYDMEFPDLFYQYCDVTYTYIDASGKAVTTTTSGNQSIEFTVPVEQAVNEYYIKANLTLKENMPTPDATAIYKVGHEMEIEIEECNASGEELNKRKNESKAELSVKGDKLIEYFTKQTQRDISTSLTYPF